MSWTDCLLTLPLPPILQMGKLSLAAARKPLKFLGEWSGAQSLGSPFLAPYKAGTEPSGVKFKASHFIAP